MIMADKLYIIYEKNIYLKKDKNWSKKIEKIENSFQLKARFLVRNLEMEINYFKNIIENPWEEDKFHRRIIKT